MRISTDQMQQQAVNLMLDQQAALAKTQQQVATGRRLATPADDPAAAAQVLDLEQARQTIGQYQKNADAARGRLSLEEGTLAGMDDVLQRLRELAVQGSNDTQTAASRAFIARETRELLGQLVTMANTRDANGEHIFAGYSGATQPFSQSASGSVAYSGDAGSRFLQIGATRQVATGDSGQDVFRAIRNGNGTFQVNSASGNSGTGIIDSGSVTDPASYVANNFRIQFTSTTTYDIINDTTSTTVASGQSYTSGAAIGFNGLQVTITGQPSATDSFTVKPGTNQDLFATALSLTTALESGAASGAGLAQFHNAMNRFLTDVDRAQNHLLDFRARIGARLSAIDSQKDINDGFSLQLTQSVSQLHDLDYASAIATLNTQLTALEAAQQVFARIQGLSLFNFLR